MDFKLKKQVIVMVIFLVIGVLSIVVIANWRTIKRKYAKTPVTASVATSEESEEPEPVDDKRIAFIGNDPMAWMSDDEFFDNSKELSVAEKVSRQMNTLTVSVTSVYRDIRVSIYGYEEILRTGEEFEVSFKNLDDPKESKTVKDIDKDGVVYISELEPADYAVSLLPKEGFIVPENSTRIKVRGSVEHSKISDISLLLKEETDVTTKIEDTRLYSAASDESEDVLTDLTAKEYATYGTELSSQNGVIDFEMLYNEGIRFVMLRAGYRGARNGTLVKDASFAENASLAKRAGLDVGAYFFSQAVNEVEAVEEASALVDMCENLYVNYPLTIVFDYAGSLARAEKVTKEDRTVIAEAFAQTVRNSGFESMIYVAANKVEDCINIKQVEKYGVCIADYEPIPQYDGLYDFWQYSDCGEIAGLEGYFPLMVDLRKD